MATSFLAVLLLLAIPAALATCYEPSPAFGVPQWREEVSGLLVLHPTEINVQYMLTSPILKSGPWIPESVFAALGSSIHNELDKDLLNSSSFSIEISSADETLWAKYHSASERNEERPGVEVVDGESQFRVASVTKVFTTLGILYQHEAGNLSLDDAVDRYIPELTEEDKGAIPWKDITVRALASQL